MFQFLYFYKYNTDLTFLSIFIHKVIVKIYLLNPETSSRKQNNLKGIGKQHQNSRRGFSPGCALPRISPEQFIKNSSFFRLHS